MSSHTYTHTHELTHTQELKHNHTHTHEFAHIHMQTHTQKHTHSHTHSCTGQPMLGAAWGRVLGPWRPGPGCPGPTPCPANSQRQRGKVSGSLPQLPTHEGLTAVPPKVLMKSTGSPTSEQLDTQLALVTVHDCCSREKTYRNKHMLSPPNQTRPSL